MKLTRSARRALQKTPVHLFVKMLQTVSREGGTCLDPMTETLHGSVEIRGIAVAQFQKHCKLTVDGHPGTATFSELWSRNKPTEAEFFARLTRAVEPEGTIYTLGQGGYGWLENQVDDECDCSGLIAHCLGLSRKPSPLFTVDGTRYWFSTTSMVSNAKEGDFFVEVPKGTPMSIVAYPDRRYKGKTKQGHTGFVKEVNGLTLWGADCSSSQSRKHGDAIKFRKLNFFGRRRSTVWLKPSWW